jgi:hypothetical protein
MATYKVWLTVKDSYGNTKEVDGGTINVNLAEMSETEVSAVAEKLDSYLATDIAVENKNTIKYSDFETRPE